MGVKVKRIIMNSLAFLDNKMRKDKNHCENYNGTVKRDANRNEEWGVVCITATTGKRVFDIYAIWGIWKESISRFFGDCVTPTQ